MPNNFQALALSPELCAVVDELGYREPTPIQAESIPLLLDGRDLIGQSKTGSGKTAAFGLPILQKLNLDAREIQALVVCPTRELCAQVARELRKLGRRHQGLHVLVVAGGEPIRPQTEALQRGVHIVVGTPGRLMDHLDRGNVQGDGVRTVVLDEADRMLDMGFQEDMEKILGALPGLRQTVFFSATFPASIEQLSRVYQRDAARITIDEPVEETPEIRQIAVTAEPEDKHRALYWALGRYPTASVLIFCNFKASVSELAGTLAAAGCSVDCLHGDLEQFNRDQVLARFRNRSISVLIATDVAGRGIDVPDLDLVINYELPPQPEVYVHRIGRTGRAGRRGLAISLVMSRQSSKLDEIEQLTGTPIERVEPSTYLSTKEAELKEAIERQAHMDTILISGGRKDKVRPGDILGALTGEAGGLDAKDVGKIEIHDRLSYVAVSRRVSQDAARSLDNGRIKAKRFRATLIKNTRF